MPEIPILRLVTGSEVDEVIAWGGPPKALRRDSDEGVAITGKFHLTNGLECLVLGTYIPNSVDSWTADVLIQPTTRMLNCLRNSISKELV